MFGDPKAAYYAFPYEMLHLVGGDLGNRLSFNLLGQVLNSYHKVFHMTYGQREKAQNVYSPGVEWPWTVNRPQFFRWCVMPVSVFLALFTSLSVLSKIFFHC